MKNSKNRAKNQQKENIPELRVPGFSDEWKEKKLGKLYDITSSKRVFQDEWTKEGVPFYRAREIVKLSKNNYVDNQLFISLEMYNSYKEKYGAPCKNDLLVTGVGTIGRLYLVGDDNKFYFKDGNIVWFKNKNLVLSQFIKYQFETRKIRKQISDSAAITTVATYTIDAAKKTFVYVPAEKEQKKIAGFLGAVDEWVENLKEQKEFIELYKKGIMQKIFSQKIRFPEFSDNWQEKKLGEIFKAERGRALSKEKISEKGENECILYGELYTTYDEVIFKIKSKTNIEEGLISKKGDLLIPSSTTTTGIDLANITALNKENVLLGGDIIILRSREKIDNIFYAYYLSDYRKHDIAKYAQGVTIIHLYYNHFKNVIIDLPSLEEQKKIANFLTSLDKMIESKQQQITQAQTWKKGLMQRMFV